MIKERDYEYQNGLVLSVQMGEENSFEKLYKTYYKKVFYICYEYFRDTMKAEDVTQEVFIRVHRNISKLTTVETFDVWIRRITYNCCHTYYKKNNRDAIGNTVDMSDDGENYIENIVADGHDNDYSKKIEFDRAKDIILVSLKDMKVENRLVGYLHFFEQLSYQEIVNITGEPMGTIATRIKRVKEKLRKELEKNHISKSSCFSILLLPNIFQIYQEYIKTIQVPKHDTVPTPMTHGGKVNPLSMKKIPYLLTIALTIVVPTTFVVNQAIQERYPNSSEYAVIEEVSFNNELTNKSIPVDVKVSEGMYDKVLLDGDSDMKVKENGTHTVALYHNDELIDSKQFDVNNIDKKSPVVKEVETADKIQLQISDDNELSYENIKMFINGIESKDFMINRDTNTIAIDKTLENKVQVSIMDIAGNKVDVDVRFYAVYK